MTVPTHITFRGTTPSLAMEATAYRWIDRLAHQFGRIHDCTVVVEVPHRRGRDIHVRVELGVPGRRITAGHDAADPYVALGDAFRAVRRQLGEQAALLRGDVKHHAAAAG